MKYLYKVTYEQKFGKDWLEYTDLVVGKENGFSAIDKANRKAMSESLDNINCSGFRLIGLERQGMIDY